MKIKFSRENTQDNQRTCTDIEESEDFAVKIQANPASPSPKPNNLYVIYIYMEISQRDACGDALTASYCFRNHPVGDPPAKLTPSS